MSGPPQRSTAERTSALVKVTVQLARGFTGAATARSAGSGTGARYGCPALHTHVLPERTTLFIQHPSESVYPPFELAKYARIDAPARRGDRSVGGRHLDASAAVALIGLVVGHVVVADGALVRGV